MKITGGCHCGAIKFKATANLDKVGICHCQDCQILSGSAFRTVVFTKVDGLEFIAGTPKIYVKTAESGNPREQSFCGNCGTPIYAADCGEQPKAYGLRLGTVDQRNELKPKFQIWCGEAVPWTDELHTLIKTSDKGPVS
jgi:hypothetical protein